MLALKMLDFSMRKFDPMPTRLMEEDLFIHLFIYLSKIFKEGSPSALAALQGTLQLNTEYIK